MRRQLLIAALCCLALPVAAVLVPQRPAAGRDGPATPAREQLEVDGLHPAVEVLLRERLKDGEDDRTSPFVTDLLSLARRHNADPHDYLPVIGCSIFRSGFAVRAVPGLVAVVMASRGVDATINDRQHLLLLDRHGRVRDRLCCQIDLSLAVIARSEFRTEVLGRQEPGGTCLVVRYRPAAGESIDPEWGHTITHGGKTFTYRWDQGRPGAVKPREWGRKGFCRVGVRGGKFLVLWPDLEKAER
jgi:hypothetical protein